MAERKSTSTGSEVVAKLSAAKVAAGGAILAAIVSAIVSYFVSNNTVKLELERIRVEESLEKAKIFQDLVDTVRKSDDPTYALLALWKVFPEDDRLIVLTALMNPTPQTISMLHAFGIADQLEQYNETITEMMVNAPRDTRKEFSSTYRDISPETVLAVSTEVVIRTGGDEREMFDLKSLIGYRPDLLRPLLKRMETDTRISGDQVLRLRMARLVYDKDSAPLVALIDEADADDTLFHMMSREMVNHLSLLSLADQDRLMERALVVLEQNQSDERLDRKTGDIIRLFSGLTVMVDPTYQQRQRFSDAVVPVYLRQARDGKPDPHKLISISRFVPGDAAEKLFLQTLACVPRDDAFVFYASFPVRDLAIEGWDADQDFATAKAEATRRIGEMGKDCITW